ncbi:MAG: GvpL/GvpF family gas vesicle protein [Isosphaeraceae bacterium]|nr:GvpL/GvpF family gas vesicle protein [Isosphaeraceae bacterium]
MNLLAFGIMRALSPPGECARELVPGPAVELLAVDGLAVAYTSRDARGTPTVDEALAFAQVTAALHQQTTVLPLRYGCWFDSEADLESLLRRHRQAFVAALDELEGCDEVGLHVLPDDVVPPPPVGTPPPDSELPSDRSRPGTAHLERLRASYARSDSSRARGDVERARIRQAMEGLYRRCYLDPSPAPGSGGLISLAFLVRRADLGPFRDAFESLQRQPGGDRLRWTGPWPPYHFADVLFKEFSP